MPAASHAAAASLRLSPESTPYALDCGRPDPASVAALLMLPFRDGASPAPSCALRSRKPAHSSASDSLSLAEVGSEKRSALSEGELGVRWKGDAGRRRLLPEAPGRARPACSRCSSVQSRYPAMTCKTWKRLTSPRSRVRKCKRWFVTTCLLYKVSTQLGREYKSNKKGRGRGRDG